MTAVPVLGREINIQEQAGGKHLICPPILNPHQEIYVIKSSANTEKYSFFSISSGVRLKLLFIKTNNTDTGWGDHHHCPQDQIIRHPYFPTLFFEVKAVSQTVVMEINEDWPEDPGLKFYLVKADDDMLANVYN